MEKSCYEIARWLNTAADRVLMRIEIRGIIETAFNLGYQARKNDQPYAGTYRKGQIDALLDSVVPPFTKATED